MPSKAEERDKLILSGVPRAEHLAWMFHRSHKFTDISDLKSEAFVGLIEAADSFRDGAGAQFKTWASYRITGRLLDYSRRCGRLNRSEYKRVQAGLDEPVRTVSVSVLKHLPCLECDAESLVIAHSLSTSLQFLLEVLNDRERLIMVESFCNGVTLKELGRSLGIGESRVSQIRMRAIEKLQEFALQPHFAKLRALL